MCSVGRKLEMQQHRYQLPLLVGSSILKRYSLKCIFPKTCFRMCVHVYRCLWAVQTKKYRKTGFIGKLFHSLFILPGKNPHTFSSLTELVLTYSTLYPSVKEGGKTDWFVIIDPNIDVSSRNNLINIQKGLPGWTVHMSLLIMRLHKTNDLFVP